MTHFSHSKIGNDGKVNGIKKLIDHINGVLEKAFFLHSPNLDLGFSDKDLKDLLKIIIQFHDFGKYTSYFQNYLLKKKSFDWTLKQHSSIGGFVAYNLLKEKDEKKSLLALYLILLHHSSLIDIRQIANKFDGNSEKIFQHQKDDLQNSLTCIENSSKICNLKNLLQYPDERAIRRAFKHWSIKNQNIKDYYLINYLFSLLIEADKLDASDTPVYTKKAIPIDVVSNYIEKLDLSKSSELQIQLRSETRKSVLSNLNKDDILEKRLFTLTAPTGIGKTLTILDFAIKLKSKIKEKENREAQIIYALPFINIIEQSYEVYKNVLPDGIKLLAHYQYADVFEQLKESENDYKYNQKLMTLDTWQCDVVITSFVQFLQTLIGNKNKLLKKFNHFAGSIIILDEVQTIRLEQIPLVGASLFYLTKFLDARIILMTATKPKIFELANEQILTKENEKAESTELLSDFGDIFKKFNRTKLVSLLNNNDEKIDEDKFINDIFGKYWDKNKSALIVVNKVNRSIDLYDKIKNYLEDNKLHNPLYYLSTNIVPSERLYIIERIKLDIKFSKKPILISTQCIEAGVDLDFDMGFRDLAPIDSIIQVAGRINRNNNADKKYSPLYIVDFGDCSKIYGTITETQSKSVFKIDNKNFVNEIKEEDYLDLIEKYLTIRTDNYYQSYELSRNIFNSMKDLKYDGERDENPVSSFQIINNQQNVKSVFIEIDETATVVLGKFRKLLRKEIDREEFEKYKKDFNQRIIAVPKYYVKSLEQEGYSAILTENICLVPKDLILKYYDPDTGFIRKKEDEDESSIVML
jgi:CRISPR-associated endonuclease/helicase Cas3